MKGSLLAKGVCRCPKGCYKAGKKLPSDMPNLKARIFGPPPSVLGEVIIPPDVFGSFTFKVEITDSQTGESLGSDKVTFLVLASGSPIL